MNLQEITKITGLPFKQKGSRMIAACNIDGTPHPRSDKTVATVGKYGAIIISEQGGECLGLNKWIEIYGDGNTIKSDKIEVKQIERIFVDEMHWGASIPNVYRGNLFTFLSTILGYQKTHDAFIRYKVGENSTDRTVFWYTNELNQVCHDATVIYGDDGRRKKVGGGFRSFGVDYGYTGQCLFGSHLIPNFKGEKCVVESEKSALIMSIVDPNRLWLATGGSNKIGPIKEDMLLYPDFDQAGSFWECIGCVDKKGCIIERVDKKRVKTWGCHNANSNLKKWWSGLRVEDGYDVGDYILNKYSKKL